MADPSDPNAIAAALRWLETLLLGSVASTIAIIAVASIGMLLLVGRVDARRAVQVIFGCFILFGASTIAAGITDMLGAGANSARMDGGPPARDAAPAPPAPLSMPAGAYDPYAGAAVPPR